MTKITRFRLQAGASAALLAFALYQPVLAEDDQPAAAAEPPVEEAAAAPTATAADRVQAKRKAMEARRAARAEERKARQEEMRSRAAARGVELPEAPQPPASPKWMSYEEMQAMMKRQGVELPPMPELADAPPQAPPMPPMPPMGVVAEEQKRMFDIIEAMTPEQQQACFALSRWQAAANRRPPMRPRGPMMGPGHIHGSGPAYGPMGRGYPPMVTPQQ